MAKGKQGKRGPAGRAAAATRRTAAVVEHPKAKQKAVLSAKEKRDQANKRDFESRLERLLQEHF